MNRNSTYKKILIKARFAIKAAIDSEGPAEAEPHIDRALELLSDLREEEADNALMALGYLIRAKQVCDEDHDFEALPRLMSAAFELRKIG